MEFQEYDEEDQKQVKSNVESSLFGSGFATMFWYALQGTALAMAYSTFSDSFDSEIILWIIAYLCRMLQTWFQIHAINCLLERKLEKMGTSWMNLYVRLSIVAMIFWNFFCIATDIVEAYQTNPLSLSVHIYNRDLQIIDKQVFNASAWSLIECFLPAFQLHLHYDSLIICFTALHQWNVNENKRKDKINENNGSNVDINGDDRNTDTDKENIPTVIIS